MGKRAEHYRLIVENISAQEHASGKLVFTDKRYLHKILAVQRVKKGDFVFVVFPEESEEIWRVTDLSEKQAVLEFVQKVKGYVAPKVYMALFLAALPSNKLASAVDAAVQLGINEINFFGAQYSNVPAQKINMTRMRSIVYNSVIQSKRLDFPHLNRFDNLEQAFDFCAAEDFEVLLFHQDSEVELRDDVLASDAAHSKIALFIGPEGGFSENEIALAQHKGVKVVRLFDTTLRSEIAAIAYSAILQYVKRKISEKNIGDQYALHS